QGGHSASRQETMPQPGQMGLSGLGQLSRPEGRYRKVQLHLVIHGCLDSVHGWDYSLHRGEGGVSPLCTETCNESLLRWEIVKARSRSFQSQLWVGTAPSSRQEPHNKRQAAGEIEWSLSNLRSPRVSWRSHGVHLAGFPAAIRHSWRAGC